MTASFSFQHRDVVTVTGPDAAPYLQGQLSQDVAGLPVGECAWTFVLSPQGKVDGWGRALRVSTDTFRIDVDLGAGARWDARLRRFLLRTKAEITVAEQVPTVAVRGATVAGGLPAVGLDVVGTDLIDVAGPGRPAVVPSDAIEVGPAEAEAARIAAGVPVWGAELDEDTIPATVGQWVIDASVSFNKGCYTGQELVARIDSRGGNVPRHLRGVVVSGPAPARGAAVVVDGAEVGTVTSAAPRPGRGDAVALAFIARSVEPGPDGTPAEVDGRPARVAHLPIRP